MALCPNINSPEWKQLVAAQGKAKAYFLWNEYSGDVPGQEYTGVLNVESITPKVKELIAKMGVSIVDLQAYARSNPEIDVTGAESLADAVGKIIAISKGATETVITEELVHIATEIINQKNPTLITEMISKIGRFKIYKDTLEQYRQIPAYQLPDGRPNIRKIKKEAVDKLVTQLVSTEINGETVKNTEELLEEENASIIRKIWNSITDWFRGQYAASNLDIFKTAANQVVEGVEGELIDGTPKELYFSVTNPQKIVQKALLDTQKTIRSVPVVIKNDNPLLDDQVSNEYEVLTNGEWVKNPKRVTDRTKAWYKSKFRNKPDFTAEEKRDNELKKELGIEFHDYFEEIHSRYFNKDGTRREFISPRPVIQDAKKASVYAKLETYYTDLIAEFSKNGRNPLVFSEIMIYDPQAKEAGTIDLLIVDEDGKSHIYDWKFMSIAKQATDVAWFKQGAYDIQLGTYKKILKNYYGVNDIGKIRAIPISLQLQRENFQNSRSPLRFTGIAIGSVNPTEIEPLTLTPVSEKTEKTGDEKLDELIVKLNAVYTQVEKTTPTTEIERSTKKERLNILKLAIRQAQANQNVRSIIDALAVTQTEGENIISEYKTIFEGRPAQSTDFENAQLSDFAGRMNDYINTASAFSKLNNELAPILKESDLSDEQKKAIQADLNEKTRLLNDNIDEIRKISGQFADKFVGLRNNVTGLLDPQMLLRGLKAGFRSLSELPLPSLRILSRLARIAQSKGQAQSLTEVNKLLEIRDKIKATGRNLLDAVKPLYQKDEKGSIVNRLIYKYSKDFYDAVEDNGEEGNRSKKWLYDNIDVEAYKKESNKILKRTLENYDKLYESDEQLRDKLKLEAVQKWDITRPDFNGWRNYIIKRHPLSKWESAEYLKIKKDQNLLDLYNFISEMNDKARDMGYLQNRVATTFLPFVRKGTAEGLSWDSGLSVISNWAESLTARADDLGFGSINEITGETENAIPKYYTTDFSRTDDPSVNDMTDVSLEFFKNQILYIQQLNKYKYMQEIEGQISLVRTIIQTKDHYKTGRFSKGVTKGGEPIIEKGNKKNAEIFDLFMETILYDNAFPADGEDFGIATGRLRAGINKVWTSMTGKPLFDEADKGKNYSVIKGMQALNNAFQLKTLGLEPISGSVNLFGANLQVAAQSGNYFNFREYVKNEFKILGDFSRKRAGVQTKAMEAFDQLVDIFMPLKDSPIYEKLKKAGVSIGAKLDSQSSDVLFAFFRQPELVLERGLFMTLLNNSMIVDGKIVNIPEFVRNKYKGRYDSAASFSKLKGNITAEIEELKKNKSITSVSKIGKDGKVEIPGLDLSNRKELQRLTDLTRTLARNATGGFTEFDSIKFNMNIWGKSMMVFKGWIPKLVDTRFSEFRKVGDDFNVRVDENGLTTGEKYDIGRIRLFYGFLSANLIKSARDIIGVLKVTDAGLDTLDKKFEYYSKYYKETTGEDLNMSKEDFIDMIRVNLRKQLQELLLLIGLNLMLFAVGFMEPDDDDDRAARNWFYFQNKTLRRFQQELMFFYNPSEWSATLSGGIFPSISLLEEVVRFGTQSAREITGYDFSNPNKSAADVRRDAMPVKYGMKLLPVTKSLVQWLSIFDIGFAEEFDVTINARPR